MSRQKQTLVIACGLAMSVFAAASTAQVAPPPTGPEKEKPTYQPEPKPQQPAARPAAQPDTQPQPQQGMQARRRNPNSGNDLPTDVPYPKLARPGPDGRILRLRQLPDIAALRSNPTVGPATVEHIMPVVYSRRHKMETAVIENLDLYWALSGGMIENMDMSDINEMGRAADMMKPLVPQVTLSQDLMNRNILSRVQGGMNKHIVQEYKREITDEIQVLDGEKGLQEVMRFVLEDSLHEAKLAYQGLLIELIGNVKEIVEKAGLESSEAKALADMQQEPGTNPAEQLEQIWAFDEAFRKLSYDEGTKLLNTLRSTRKFENIAPTISTIDVMHERKKIYKGDFGLKVTDLRTDEVKFDSNAKKNEQGEQPESETGDN